MGSQLAANLTEHFTVFDPQNPEIAKLYAAQKRESTDLKALELCNVLLGSQVSVVAAILLQIQFS